MIFKLLLRQLFLQKSLQFLFLLILIQITWKFNWRWRRNLLSLTSRPLSGVMKGWPLVYMSDVSSGFAVVRLRCDVGNTLAGLLCIGWEPGACPGLVKGQPGEGVRVRACVTVEFSFFSFTYPHPTWQHGKVTALSLLLFSTSYIPLSALCLAYDLYHYNYYCYYYYCYFLN